MQLAQSQSNSHPLILLPSPDHCHRFRPHYDFTAFQQEVAATNADLIDHLSSSIRSQYLSYIQATRLISYSFWGCSVGLAVFAHKIPILPKMLGINTWKLFTFRLAALVLPYLWMEEIMADAESEEVKSLYRNARPQYIRYKLTGDIAELGGRIQLIGEPLSIEQPIEPASPKRSQITDI